MDLNNTMEYRIGLEKQNKRNDQVTELILDNCRASQISGLTDEFVNLETLSLINVGLVTLKGFPKLPKLKKLELSDNRLTGGLNLLHGSPKLQHLNISGNRIKDLDALEPLKEFHDLVTLDLYNCEVTKADDYRKKVFELLPNLHSLDGYDKNECEVADTSDSEDEGSEVENRIVRENEVEDDEELEGEEDADNEESSEYDEEEYTGGLDDEDEDDDLEDDDEDAEEDLDEEDDDDEDDEAEAEEQSLVSHDQDTGSASLEPQQTSNQAVAATESLKDDSVGVTDNGDEVELIEKDDSSHLNGGSGVQEHGVYDDEDDECDDGEEEPGLKDLVNDMDEGDSENDADFEPSHEVDDRDHEIDPEDDADEEANNSTNNLVSTSTIDATESNESENSKRGIKRKQFDEDGGDEPVEDEVVS